MPSHPATPATPFDIYTDTVGAARIGLGLDLPGTCQGDALVEVGKHPLLLGQSSAPVVLSGHCAQDIPPTLLARYQSPPSAMDLGAVNMAQVHIGASVSPAPVTQTHYLAAPQPPAIFQPTAALPMALQYQAALAGIQLGLPGPNTAAALADGTHNLSQSTEWLPWQNVAAVNNQTKNVGFSHGIHFLSPPHPSHLLPPSLLPPKVSLYTT